MTLTPKLTPDQEELQDMIYRLTQKNPEKIRELADELGVSLPTIRRWIEGESMAHSIIARAIIKYLKSRSQAS